MGKARVVGFGDNDTCGNCGADLTVYGSVISVYSVGVSSCVTEEEPDEGDREAVRENVGDAELYRQVCKACDEILWQDENVIAWRLS